MIKLNTFESYNELSNSLIDLLVTNLELPNSIMLSGGKTPYDIYNKIAKLKPVINKECKLFLSDERYVKANSSENNAYNLSNMLNKLNCYDNFIPVNTDLEPNSAAEDYGKKINAVTPIKIGLLGIGQDGHTAGIFSNNDAISSNKNPVFITKRPNGMLGISVSNYFIQKIEKIVLLAVSNDKKNILTTLLNNPSAIPAGLILNKHSNVEIWTDVKLEINSNIL